MGCTAYMAPHVPKKGVEPDHVHNGNLDDSA